MVIYVNMAVVDESQKSHFEKRKRNLKAISPISRGEREIWIHFPQFREEKEKFENHFSNFERRKRKLNSLSLVSRREREIRQNILNFREEKEKFWLYFYNFEKRRRILKFFPFISRVEREKWNSLFLLEQSPVKWFSRQHQKCIWKLDRGQWLGLCWCDSGLWGWSSPGSPKGDLGRLQTTNNHPHPLLLAGGFLLLSKSFLLRWKMEVRRRDLRPNFDEKQGTKSWISREEKVFF